jgi:hypothetical protein
MNSQEIPFEEMVEKHLPKEVPVSDEVIIKALQKYYRIFL